MKTPDFTTAIIVDQSPLEAYNAINNPLSWWSQEIVGQTDKLNAEWDYHYKDVHICKMRITELIPGEKVEWVVLENHFNFIKDQSEWVGTKVIFDISKKDDKTQIVFTHQGLVPEYECFDICQNAWTDYIQNSLKSLITTGKGNPNPIEEIVKEAADKAEKM